MKDGCYKSIEKCLIVATINPISHSHPVHHGTPTFFNVLIDKFIVCKCREIEYIFLHKEIRYFIQLAINTHIYCINNSKLVFGAF